MKVEPRFITTQNALDDACRRWRDVGRFAFDTEFIRDETFDAALCLVQVACEQCVTLIDPVADLTVEPFWNLVSDPDVLSIVHAGKEDFEVCLRQTGKTPRNVFDVQIAAGLVGLGYPLSLSRLSSATVRKRISKGQTLTDWLRRPLTQDQIRYAVDDVRFLPAIYRQLQKQLDALGREGWAREEFAKFEEEATYRPPTEDRLFKLRGTKRLDGNSLAVLARLIEWRDAWAQEKNRPLRAMMRDDVLVEIARQKPTRPAELEVMRGFPQAKNKKVVGEILDVIDRAKKIPKSEWPRPYPHRDETPMLRAVQDMLSAVTRVVCHEEQMSHELIGGAQRLRDFVDFLLDRTTERPMLLTGWRREFIGQRLVDLLEGRSELHISGWPDDFRLDVIQHG